MTKKTITLEFEVPEDARTPWLEIGRALLALAVHFLREDARRGEARFAGAYRFLSAAGERALKQEIAARRKEERS